MDENKSNVEGAVNSTKEKTTAVFGKVVDFVKQHKKVLLGIVVVVLVLVVLSNLFLGGKKKVIKKFIKAMNGTNIEKVYSYIDLAGANTFNKLDKDDYEDFYDEYKDYVDSDEWEDAEEDFKDNLEDNKEDIEDSMDDDESKYKIKEFKGTEKLGKNLWEVKVKLELIDEDDDESTNTVKFYVMKKGLKYYIVGDNNYMVSALSYMFSY